MAWVLTAAATLLTLVMAMVAYYMLRPVDFDGRGKYGALALLFPLHLLAVTFIGAVLAFTAWWGGFALASVVFGVDTVLSAFIALWPSVAVWRYARNERVPATQAHILERALSDAGDAHVTCLLPANDHAFDVNWGGFGTQIARAKLEAFLDLYG
jgi:hypothetical protein